MTETPAVTEIKRLLVEGAQTDTVGLWAVLWEAKQISSSRDEARSVTLAAIREALTDGSIVAGQFVDQDGATFAFAPWNLAVNEIVSRIEREWAALGREPNVGDIVWFVAPDLLPVTARQTPMGKDWSPL